MRRVSAMIPPRALILGALCASIPACKVGPNYTSPEVKMNPGWLSPTEQSPQAANSAWWESFGDPTLNTLIDEAYKNNLALRAAGLRVIEARAARGIAVGNFYPQLQEIYGNIRNNRQSAASPAAGEDLNFADASIGLQASWELDFWGKFRRGIEASDAELLATVADYDSVLVSLVADIATNYVLARSLEERISFAKANVVLQEETLRLTQIRFKAGKVSELDVTTASSLLSNTQALIPQLEDGLRQATLAIGVLLGRSPSDLEKELTPAAGHERIVPDPPAQIATGVPADLLRRRPDIRTAERIAAAECARIGVAKADLYPSISITGATGFASSNYEGVRAPDLSDLFKSSSFTGFIGLQVNWPILNYGRITNNIRLQDARFERAATTYLQTVLAASADVEAGLSAFLKARERADSLAQSVSSLQRSVDLSLIQYRAGATDFIRVNNAQTELVVAQDTQVVARAAVALGAIRSYRALGGGWEIRQNAEFVDAATVDRMRARTNWGDLLAPTTPDQPTTPAQPTQPQTPWFMRPGAEG